MIFQRQIVVPTRGRATHELSAEVSGVVSASGIRVGLCNVFIEHTSASLIMCENADSTVRSDLERFMAALIVDGDPMFEHRSEGIDDMPAHLRSVLTQTSITLPVADGRCILGTWQGIYLWEHRLRPHQRRVFITVFGD